MPIKHEVKPSALLGIEATRRVLYCTYSKSYVGQAREFNQLYYLVIYITKLQSVVAYFSSCY